MPQIPSHPMYNLGQGSGKPLTKPTVVTPEKPPDIEVLRDLCKTAPDIVKMMIEKHKLPYRIDESGSLVDSLKGTDLYLNKFITNDPACLDMKQQAVALAKCPDEILITGETGTGKEIIARAMIGDRKGNFVAINCAGMPEQLIESELFGHVRGAFTGADSSKQGLFARASDGVMFLDEIGELPIQVQAKLLRAVQDKVIRRVGSNEEETISCKFVAATHRDLKKMTSEGTFREDLYARLSTFELHIPPLRSRIADIELIARKERDGDAFWTAFVESGRPVSDIDLTYNVRSIQRCVKRYKVLGRLILA